MLVQTNDKQSPSDSAGEPEAPPPRWAVWLATGFGVGYLPLMPGTYGSALGVPLYFVLDAWASHLPSGLWLVFFIILLIAVLSASVISTALPHFSEQDPAPIVLDEVAGQLITLLPIAFFQREHAATWIEVGTGFLLFRALDVLKPDPIRKLGHLKGAWGVLADDLGAGVLAAIILFGIIQLGWFPGPP